MNRDSLELPLGQVDGLFGPLSGLGPAVILYIDLSGRHVSYQGKVVALTNQEFTLLRLLADHAKRSPGSCVARMS